MNIILTGLRGSGKTKIGRLLAEKLKFKFIDIDKEIEKYQKMTIRRIYKKFGWEYFREKEKMAVKRLSKINIKNSVIALGGGTIIYPENQKILKKLGKIIYLKRSPEECVKYLQASKKYRPPLTKTADRLKELKQIYQERKEIYKKSANITINRTNNLEKDVKKILLKLNLHS